MAFYNTPESRNTSEYRQKLAHYLTGKWACACPDVSTAYWDESAWVTWIDNHGKWISEKGE